MYACFYMQTYLKLGANLFENGLEEKDSTSNTWEEMWGAWRGNN